jgi:uncharacterized protein YkwD
VFFLAGNAILIFILLAKSFTPINSGTIDLSFKITPSLSVSPSLSPTPSVTPTPTVTPTPSGPETLTGWRPTITFTPSISKPISSPEGRRSSPTKIPSNVPIKTNTITSSPSNTPIPQVANDIGQNLLNQINSFRSSKGLPPLSTDGYTCGFAVLRANEIVNSFNHDGFKNRIDSKTLPYPSYSSVAENIAMNSDPNQVVPGWINSAGHNENMSKDVPHGCVGKSGDYYAFEAWKP